MQPNFDKSLNFIPVRGNFTRGIFASAYTRCDEPIERLRELYRTFYHDAPFTKITEENPSLKQVVNTNKCMVFLEKHDDKILIITVDATFGDVCSLDFFAVDMKASLGWVGNFVWPNVVANRPIAAGRYLG